VLGHGSRDETVEFAPTQPKLFRAEGRQDGKQRGLARYGGQFDCSAVRRGGSESKPVPSRRVGELKEKVVTAAGCERVTALR